MQLLLGCGGQRLPWFPVDAYDLLLRRVQVSGHDPCFRDGVTALVYQYAISMREGPVKKFDYCAARRVVADHSDRVDGGSKSHQVVRRIRGASGDESFFFMADNDDGRLARKLVRFSKNVYVGHNVTDNGDTGLLEILNKLAICRGFCHQAFLNFFASARNISIPLSVSGCFSIASRTFGGIVSMSAPISPDWITCIGCRMLATMTSVRIAS